MEDSIAKTEEVSLLQIIGSILNKRECESIKVEDWPLLISLAERHNVLQYLFIYANRLAPPEKPKEKIFAELKSAYTQELAKSVNQMYAVEEMQTAFEKKEIYNMAIKGVCTKKRYSDEILRTMSDIDILFKAEQQKAIFDIMTPLGYIDHREGRKNDTYSQPPYIFVETHREMVAADSEFSDYYKNIWDRCKPKEGCVYTYEMTPEDEFIFNIIHLIEHFRHGGAGVRFIMDIFVYNSLEMNRDYIDKEFEKLGVTEFYQNVSFLAESWFGDSPPELSSDKKKLIEKLGSFIMEEGVFGSVERSSNLAVDNGRWSFLLKTCFPSYIDMCSMFPWLKGKPFLLPYSWALRGYRSLKYRKSNVSFQLKRFSTGDAEKGRELKNFYRQCGL